MTQRLLCVSQLLVVFSCSLAQTGESPPTSLPPGKGTNNEQAAAKTALLQELLSRSDQRVADLEQRLNEERTRANQQQSDSSSQFFWSLGVGGLIGAFQLYLAFRQTWLMNRQANASETMNNIATSQANAAAETNILMKRQQSLERAFLKMECPRIEIKFSEGESVKGMPTVVCDFINTGKSSAYVTHIALSCESFIQKDELYPDKNAMFKRAYFPDSTIVMPGSKIHRTEMSRFERHRLDDSCWFIAGVIYTDDLGIIHENRSAVQWNGYQWITSHLHGFLSYTRDESGYIGNST